jgi:hypothetical protein
MELLCPLLVLGASSMLSSTRILLVAVAISQPNPKSERRRAMPRFLQWWLPKGVVARMNSPLPPSPRLIGNHRPPCPDPRQSQWKFRGLLRLQSVISKPSIGPSIYALKAMRFRTRVVPWPTDPVPFKDLPAGSLRSC